MDKIELHKQICDKLNDLYKAKNADYGDSFSQLRQRYPNFVCMRLFDKLNRLDTVIKPDYECKVSDEKIEDTLMDIANYCIMELVERQSKCDKSDNTTRQPSSFNVKDALKFLTSFKVNCLDTVSCTDCPAYVIINDSYNCFLEYSKGKAQQCLDRLKEIK